MMSILSLLSNIRTLLLVFVFMSFSFLAAHAGVKDSDSTKLIKSIMQKEKQYKIPTGLLLAIADVESALSLWVVNRSGKRIAFDNKTDLLEYLQKNKHEINIDSIDVGVMQINIKYHKNNFKSLAHMIDPSANIDYAARFLCKLRNQHKSWWLAVGAYHNMNYKVNVPYKEKVFKSWQIIKRKILFSKI